MDIKVDWKIKPEFIHSTGDANTFARNIAAKIETAVKQKATIDEIRVILREVPDESGMQGSGAPELLGVIFF